MKPNANKPDPFEETIADYDRVALPDEWKAGLIEHAISASTSRPSKRSQMSWVKVFVLGITTCWVVILILNFATPDSINSQVGSSSADLSLLAKYIKLQNDLSTY